MGTWSVPWQTMESAREFGERMGRPWIAVVKEVEYLDFGTIRVGDRRSLGEDEEIKVFRGGERVQPIGTVTAFGWDAEALGRLCGDDHLVIDLDRVTRTLAQMPAPDRLALVLRTEHSLPYEEIARILEISIGAARVRVHRARRRLLALTMTNNGGE